MDFTFEVSKLYGVLFFDILNQDKDYVIMLVNYMIEKGENAPKVKSATRTKQNANSETRVRVNDRTATGGWW